jgi:GTP-binding protein HflX
MPFTKPSRGKAILLSVSTPDRTDADVDRSLKELELLLEGLHFTTLGRYTQRRPEGPTATYFGEGRLAEVARVTGGPGHLPRGPAPSEPLPSSSELLAVVDDELSPGVLRNLERALGVPVWDRTQVILQIFEARARSKEALLQVELARIAYELPRVRDDHTLGDREGGGGRASRGASNVELAKRRLRDRAAGIRAELEALGPLTRAPAAAGAF